MKKSGFFWVSYADLMTSLFFIMLVLYVITLTILQGEMGKIIAQNEQLKKITQIEEQFRPLQKDASFHYLENCNKYVAKDLIGIEIFESNESIIKQKYIENTIIVGKKVETFLNALIAENNDFKYLLIIEGNMANTWDMKLNKDSAYGYKKSYERALAVYNLWLKNSITFRKENIEVLITGSGFNGLCRDEIEDNNKRFSIQILPKVSKIDY
ncbi:hypothetical protein [Aestuariibaculum lutulentum]|uniref:OmpA-like domain-containing protein n=1 Tax=Aestuariibaculum lutulentum TaxID=2920935 RepID=A0ABS9RJC4_9FLAO|nr:hypothetical protein [Aestuariibaculum lutulentum]MCH4552207.1 hypothetical protein [Aestuariibaculum lutulentum]